MFFVIISFDGEGWFRKKEKGIHLLLGCNKFPPIFNMMQFQFPPNVVIESMYFICFCQFLLDRFQVFKSFPKARGKELEIYLRMEE